MAVKPEKCYNCDRTIGRMEQAYLWQGSVVCLECYRRLSEAAAPPPPPRQQAAPAPASAIGAPPRPQQSVEQSQLIACPGCGRAVSPSANVCPHCGAPIQGKPTTIEKTGKQLKAMLLICGLVACIGTVVAISGASEGSWGMRGVGFFLLGTGILGFVVTKVVMWWEHG